MKKTKTEKKKMSKKTTKKTEKQSSKKKAELSKKGAPTRGWDSSLM
ncbi:hypothetical protein [Lactobacillus delbrueckii]|nr:hypothetical protein [Lactobacillus delbrueckii]